MKKRGERGRRGGVQARKPRQFGPAAAPVDSRPDTKRDSEVAKSTHILQIEKPIYGGGFLARAEGKAVFVPLALPGEQVRLRIVEGKRSYATAEIEEIVAAAQERVMPKCRHFGACGGCQYQHADYAAQLDFKRAILRETLERGGVRTPGEIAVLAGETWVYRNRIRVAFDAQGRPGYRGRRSHGVIPIAECPIAAPLLVRAALAAGEIAQRARPAMRPSEISFFCNGNARELLVSVVSADAGKGAFEGFAQALAEHIPELKGAELVREEKQGRSQGRVAEWGETSLLYTAGGFQYRVDQGAFFQVNRWLVDGLLDLVTTGQRGELAWDLFAGVGLFARKLAESFTRAVAVEAAPVATRTLGENLRGTRATAVRASTLDFLRSARKDERPDLIVLDPPRAGLGAETTGLLAEVAAPNVTYVSCDPATLARDLRALSGSGYSIESVTLADLFPQTFHLETVVRLRR